MNYLELAKTKLYGGGNYFASMLPDSQCWVIWDKVKPEGISFADVEMAWTSFDLAARMFKFAWNGMLQGDMKHKEYKIHPTQKPIALYKWLLKRYAKPGDKILDTHVGSASSLIACHDLGFQYVGFEIDTDYYNLAKKRLEQETAQINIMQFLKQQEQDGDTN